MQVNNMLKRFRRELYKTLSMFCLKSAKTDYFGLNLKVPLIHGLGYGFLVPDDKWMSDCLSVFLKLKQGAVIDVGTNIGLYLVKLKSINTDRDYVGFEPNAACNNYTTELIRINNFKNVNVMPFALSNKREIRTFYIRRKADKMGSLNEYARYGEKGKFSYDVFTFPADEFIEILSFNEICSIKIDVEGSELEVLEGLAGSIKKYSPFIYCEIWQLPDISHPTYDIKLERLKKIFNLVNKLNYNILGVPVKNNSEIDILDSIEKFTTKYRRDYILVHDSEVEPLRRALTSL
ncbi:hypothetical protein MNBD_GAMMA09-576 [hydrothermal vent metagenome]|uniref:Methyltransferase FkbM domain-containing protein n=1 Tax=hydrothermal vent metagenome TaxID=652676 RepID=A0A3B0X3Z4_9ZZZZ